MFGVIFIVLLFSNALVLLTADKTYYNLNEAERLFTDFILTHEKLYETREQYDQRFEIFKYNLLRINDLNKEHEATFGINKFADLTQEEFEETHLGFFPQETKYQEKIKVENDWIANAPDSLDYRDQGLVTEVKDQGGCGSCYIFSAIGNIEGQFAKKYKQLISLSEQQVLDCDKEPKDLGCGGGTMLNAMHALIKQGGSMREEDYAYTAAVGNCSTDPKKVVVKITNASEIDTSTEDLLAGALAKYGPLSIAICMPFWQFYQGGVLSPMNCDNPINHGVVLVGYGTVPGGRDYWIIKNSWGPKWGEDGYFRLEKGRGYCNIGKHLTTTAEIA